MTLWKRMLAAGWSALAVFMLAAMAFPNAILGFVWRVHLAPILKPLTVLLLLASAAYGIAALYRAGMKRP